MSEQEEEFETPKKSAPLATELFRVGIRVPPFWPEEPEIWFAQVEGQFSVSNITSDATKFNYVIGQLDHQFSKEVKDIIISPPPTEKYEKLKSELIKRLSASKEKKVHQLLMHEDLGDRKPSQFLRHLRGLAGSGVPEDFIRTIWSSRLPNHVQTLLASQPQSCLETLADLADRVQDIVTPARQIAATSSLSSAPGSVVDSMVNEIAELKRAVKNLTVQLNRQDRRSRPPQRTNSRERRKRSTTRSHSNYRKYPICWYHSKYGKKANSCQTPCDYEKSGNSRGDL